MVQIFYSSGTLRSVSWEHYVGDRLPIETNSLRRRTSDTLLRKSKNCLHLCFLVFFPSFSTFCFLNTLTCAIICSISENVNGWDRLKRRLRLRHLNSHEDANSIYRVSQDEWTKLRESVPYVKRYRYNPKHLYPKLFGYGDNGQRSLKLWQLLHTYWLPNTY